MKIALLTIQNANNYGAILQTYAMQKVLEKYGDVDVLNYENRHISRSFDLVRIKPTLRGLLGTGKDLFRLFPRYRAIKKFKNFISDEIKLTEKLNHKDLLAGKANNYDVYIAGSDQIWNPACVNEDSHIDFAYFLDFAPRKAKKVAYASSIGGYSYKIDESKLVKKALQSFDYLSVREENSRNYFSRLLERTVDHVLDPSLLLKKEDWINLVDAKNRTVTSEKYILLYTVPKVPLIRKVVEFYSTKLGLKVISIDQGLFANAKIDQQIRDAGPKEFLELFQNSEFVITDSFHGTCFALNFGKDFVAVSSGSHATRIESLLKLVGLQERLIKESAIPTILPPASINLDEALERLSGAREESLKYISMSIKK